MDICTFFFLILTSALLVSPIILPDLIFIFIHHHLYKPHSKIISTNLTGVVAMLVTFIQELFSLNLSQSPATLTEVFHDIPQSL
jgi:hypothetical protein